MGPILLRAINNSPALITSRGTKGSLGTLEVLLLTLASIIPRTSHAESWKGLNRGSALISTSPILRIIVAITPKKGPSTAAGSREWIPRTQVTTQEDIHHLRIISAAPTTKRISGMPHRGILTEVTSNLLTGTTTIRGREDREGISTLPTQAKTSSTLRSPTPSSDRKGESCTLEGSLTEMKGEATSIPRVG